MPPETPFAPACSPQSFLETVGAAEALRRLSEGLGSREPFLLLTGGPGTGKTALVHAAIARWESAARVACLAYPALTGAEMLEEIARRLGVEPPEGASRPRLLACVIAAVAEVAAGGRVAVIVVDDAHDLAASVLEELRLLVNAAQQAGHALEVVLVGLPALEANLDDPSLVALRQRVSVRVRLVALSPGETRRYLRHRTDAAGAEGSRLFPRKACEEIAAISGGVPRQINAIAGEALRRARTAGAEAVASEHVQAAAMALGLALPAGGMADVAEEDDELATAPAADERAPEPAPAAPVAPPAKAGRTRSPAASRTRAVVAPAAASEPAAAPAAAAAPVPAATSASVEPAIAREPAPEPHEPVPPDSHEVEEWVHRFIGDKGPLQISSLAIAEGRSSSRRLVVDVADEDEPAAEDAAPLRLSVRPRRSRGRRRRVPVSALTAALVAIVGITAAVLVMRAGGRAHRPASPPEAAPASVTVTPRPGPASAPPLAVATVTPVAPRPTIMTARPVAERPTLAPARPGAPAPLAVAREPVIGTASPGRGTRYTLDVGGYPDLQLAIADRDLLRHLTGLEAWVVPATGGVPGPHRVVLGIYRTRERAEAAAHLLLSARTLPHAQPVPLPPRDVRQ